MIFFGAFLFFLCIIIAEKFIIPIYLILLIGVVSAILFFIKRSRVLSVIGLFVTFVLIRSEIYYPKNHISQLLDHQTIIRERISFEIRKIIKEKTSYTSYKIKLLSIDNCEIKGDTYLISKIDSLQIGNKYKALLELKSFEENTNPNQFNYEKFSSRKSIFGSATNLSQIYLLKSQKFNYHRFIHKIRKQIIHRIYLRFPLHKEFVAAILVGEREYESKRVKNIQASGLQHLLAVSGLHVGIISLVLMLITKSLINNRKVAYIITIIFMYFYGELCLWQPSVMRAVCMIAIFLVGRIIERPITAIRSLAISFYVLVIIEPYQIFAVGFQLSYLAVFVLLTYIKISEFHIKRFVESRLLRKLISFILVSSLLSVCLAPITIYNFNEVNFNGIISNFIGISFIALLLPLIVFIMILPFNGFFLMIYQKSFELIMYFFDFLLENTAKLPMKVSFISFSEIQLILGISIVLALPLLRKLNNKNFKIILSTIGMVFLSTFFLHEKEELAKITYFDCGLGDLSLIEFENRTMMIDCGPGIKERNSFKNSALPYFMNKGIKRLDYLVITHGHFDHYGGLPDLLENVKIDTILITPNFYNQNIIQKYEEYLRESTISLCTAPREIPFGKAEIRIIHPDSLYFDKNKNNMSIVILFDYIDAEFLFTGDLEEEGEDYLLEKYEKILDCDVLKVGHHGSASSTDLDFLAETTPEYAIISTALKNRFRFPHSQTMTRLESFQNKLFITGEDGAIQFKTNGKTFKINTIRTKENYFDDTI